MNKGENYTAFVALYKQYNELTVEKLNETHEHAPAAFQKLTGVGNCRTCTLCTAIVRSIDETFGAQNEPLNACRRCHIMISTGKECIGNDKYYRLFGYTDPEQLIVVIHDIAENMKQFIDENDL